MGSNKAPLEQVRIHERALQEQVAAALERVGPDLRWMTNDPAGRGAVRGAVLAAIPEAQARGEQPVVRQLEVRAAHPDVVAVLWRAGVEDVVPCEALPADGVYPCVLGMDGVQVAMDHDDPTRAVFSTKLQQTGPRAEPVDLAAWARMDRPHRCVEPACGWEGAPTVLRSLMLEGTSAVGANEWVVQPLREQLSPLCPRCLERIVAEGCDGVVVRNMQPIEEDDHAG